MTIQWNLRKKLLLPPFLTILLSMSIVTFISHETATQTLHTTIRSQLEQLSTVLVRQIHLWLEETQNRIEIYAELADLGQLLSQAENTVAIQNAVDYLQSRYDYQSAAVIHIDGSIHSQVGFEISQAQVLESQVFQQALLGKIGFSNVFLQNQQLLFAVAAPIFHQENVIGVIYCVIPFKFLSQVTVDPVRIGESGYAYLLDSDGHFIAHPDKNLLFEPIQKYDFGEQLVEQRMGYMQYHFHGHDAAVYLNTISSHQWILGVRADQSELFAELATVRNQTMIVNGIALALMLWILYSSANRLINPLQQIKNQLVLLARGQVPSTDIRYRGRDEIREITNATKQLRHSLRSTISQANQISAGNYDQQIKLLSDHDQLGQALSDMTSNLREATQKAADQDWIKTGQAELSHVLGGEHDLITLTTRFINFLTPYVNANVGAVYLFEEEGNKEKENGLPSGKLRMLASHTYEKRKHFKSQFALGEGVIGQAGLEQKLFHLANAPHDYVSIKSGLGKTLPKGILVIPFDYEGQLKGVVELAAIQAFTNLQIEFLQQIMTTFATAVHTTQSRLHVQQLVQELQS